MLHIQRIQGSRFREATGPAKTFKLAARRPLLARVARAYDLYGTFQAAQHPKLSAGCSYAGHDSMETYITR